MARLSTNLCLILLLTNRATPLCTPCLISYIWYLGNKVGSKLVPSLRRVSCMEIASALLKYVIFSVCCDLIPLTLQCLSLKIVRKRGVSMCEITLDLTNKLQNGLGNGRQR